MPALLATNQLEPARPADAGFKAPPTSFEAAVDVDESTSTELRRRRRRKSVYCFNCNRYELHVEKWEMTWFYPFLLGFSFGLVKIFGPYKCVCCGHKRLTIFNACHPRMIVRSITGNQTAPPQD